MAQPHAPAVERLGVDAAIINTDALEQTIAKAEQDPSALKQHVSFYGEWQTHEGQPQFRTTIPVPNGEPFVFEADFPPPMGGTGSAPDPWLTVSGAGWPATR